MLCHDHRVKKEQNSRASAGHTQPVVNPMDGGVPVIVTSSLSLGCVAEIN